MVDEGPLYLDIDLEIIDCRVGKSSNLLAF